MTKFQLIVLGLLAAIACSIFALIATILVGTFDREEALPALPAATVKLTYTPTATPTATEPTYTPTSIPPSPTSTPSVTVSPTSTPSVTVSPTAQQVTNEDDLVQNLKAALGRGNRNIKRIEKADINFGIINIKWAINDNLTDNMIATGIKIDIVNILKTIDKSEIEYSLINLEGTFSLADVYGNTSEKTVVWATYERETIEKINWERFLHKDIYNISSTHKFHPAIKNIQ